LSYLIYEYKPVFVCRLFIERVAYDSHFFIFLIIESIDSDISSHFSNETENDSQCFAIQVSVLEGVQTICDSSTHEYQYSNNSCIFSCKMILDFAKTTFFGSIIVIKTRKILSDLILFIFVFMSIFFYVFFILLLFNGVILV